MLQVEQTSLEGERIDDYLVPVPHARSVLRDALTSPRVIEARLQRRLDQTPLDVVIRSQSVVDDQQSAEPVTLLVLADISAEKAARERLRDLQDQLSRVQRLKTVGEMSASLAHELGQHQVMSGQINPAQVQEQLARIERAATRAAEILKRFRAYGRNTSLTLVPLDFSAMLAEIQELCGPLFKETGVTLQSDVRQPLPTVLGDPLLIQQVLINLIQNAVQALDDLPADRRALTLDIGPAPEQDRVQLVVADRGRGIPAELLPRLTEPFFTTRPSGLGLGLSICRTIMEDHEGHLSITSEAGVGTTVRLQLPAAVSESAYA
jgi:C4-dicarboxylate-specific signal transduction histidine kinase